MLKMKMKKRLFAALVPLCAGALILPTVAAGFAPQEAYFSTYEVLGEGLTYEEYYVDTNNTPQHGYLLTYSYTEEGSVFPIVTTGTHVYGGETVTAMGKLLAEQGQNVIGGTNGDFFSFATGIPLGALVSDGKVLSTDAGQNAFGIRADGSYLIGDPALTVTMTRIGVAEEVRDAAAKEAEKAENAEEAEGAVEAETEADEKANAETAPSETDAVDTKPTDTEATETERTPMPEIARDAAYEKTYAIAHIGKYPAVWGAYLNTYDYGKTTHSTEASTEFVFALCDGEIALSSPVTAVLTAIYTDATNTPIPKGGFVISVENGCKTFSAYADLVVGDAVEIEVTAAEGWTDAVTVIGGGEILIKNGEICDDLLGEAHAKTAKPRLAIGYTADGMLKLFALDGKSKNSDSTGMNLNSLAETMQALGCVEALNLDGGGSVTVVLRGKDGVLSVGNVPSEGRARAVSNAIFFVNTAPSDGVAYFAELSPVVPLVYKQSKLALSLAFYDRARMSVEAPENMTVTWSCEGGEVDENGVFTPNEDVGEKRVTATVTVSDEAGMQKELWRVSQTITVLDTLDSLHITEAPRTVPLGTEGEVAFAAIGKYKGYTVAVDNTYLTAVFTETMNASCADGIITEHLTVQSTNTDGYGILEGFPTHEVRVALGDDSAVYDTCEVTFGAAPSVLWPMDDEKPGVLFSSDENAVFLSADGMGYDGGTALSFNGSYLAPNETPVLANPLKRVSMWMRGEIPEDLCMTVRIGETLYDIPWVKVFDNVRLGGYSRYSADLQSLFADGVAECAIVRLISSDTPFFAYLDEVCADYGDALTVFSDMDGHWAEDSVMRLYDMGIATGSKDGSYYRYDPSGALTRGAFAKLLCLYIGLVPREDATLDTMFADAEDTPIWAVPYIAAVVEAGLMRGKTVTETATATDAGEVADTESAKAPTLAFSANDVMTRAEVLQVLGALMVEREETAEEHIEIPTFSDDAEIPNWARVNIEYCIARGIVSGFSDGTLRPMAGISRAEIAALLVRMEKEL